MMVIIMMIMIIIILILGKKKREKREENEENGIPNFESHMTLPAYLKEGHVYRLDSKDLTLS